MQVVANFDGQVFFFPTLCGYTQARPLAFGKLAVFGFLWARLAWEAHAQMFIIHSTLSHALELVSKELNHLAAILHVYAGGLNFIK